MNCVFNVCQLKKHYRREEMGIRLDMYLEGDQIYLQVCTDEPIVGELEVFSGHSKDPVTLRLGDSGKSGTSHSRKVLCSQDEFDGNVTLNLRMCPRVLRGKETCLEHSIISVSDVRHQRS
jgi:hypothetical protein